MGRAIIANLLIQRGFKAMGSAHDQAKVWAQGAHDWATKFEPHFEPLWQQMLAMAGVTKGTRFFDAGCGSGGASVMAEKRGARVAGLDATPELISIAQQRMPHAPFVVGDMEEMPHDDKSFDVVFAANAVQFTYDPAQALTEIKRVLAPHGHAIVAVFTDIERNNMGTFIKALAGLLPQPPKVGPFALGKPGLLETAIEKSGLKVVRDVEVPCDFVYPDVEDFWVTFRSAGPTRTAIGNVGEERTKQAALESVKPFVKPNGSLHLKNISHVVTLEA